MTTTQFFSELESIVEAPVGSIRGAESLRDLDGLGWNSLAVITFIAMVDEKLGLSLSADDLAKCKSVPDLRELVAAKLTS
jgi:acyl carrier protein